MAIPDVGSTDRGHRHVLVLAHSWPPDGQVGAVRAVYLSHNLARCGWNPVVVTVRGEYHELRNPHGIRGQESARVIRTRAFPNPAKALASIRDLLRGDGQAGGGRTLIKAPAESGRGEHRRKGGLRRLALSLLTTPDELTGWFPFALGESLNAVRRYSPSCVISTAPPFTAHLVGLALKRISGLPWIADFRDPWTWRDGPDPHEVSVLSTRINRALEWGVMRSADRIVCVTDSVKERYQRLYPGRPPERWSTISNGFDEAEAPWHQPVGAFDRFTLTYVGGFDFLRTPATVLESLAELIAEGTIRRDRLSVRFVGPCEWAGRESVGEMIERLGLVGVAELVGFRPRPEAIREMRMASALLLLGGTQRSSVAAKLFEYLASETPILAETYEGEATRILQRTGAGRAVPPGDKEAIKSCLSEWYSSWESGGRVHLPNRDPIAVAEYSWTRLGSRYAEILARCVRS